MDLCRNTPKQIFVTEKLVLMKYECKGVFDMHCHIMCGVDDGAKNLAQSKKMLEIAYYEGIRHVILTPHYNKRFWDVSREQFNQGYQSILELVENMYPDMTVHMGAEIFYNEETLDELEQKAIPTMNGGKYVLIEFMTSISYRSMKNAIMGIQQRDYIPIIAHVERYESLLKDSSLVGELVELGAYIQVNASTIAGDNGRLAKKMAKTLLKSGWLHFVGTDAHRDNQRAPRIRDAYIYVAKKFGEQIATKLFVDNPQCIIDNIYIEE